MSAWELIKTMSPEAFAALCETRGLEVPPDLLHGLQHNVAAILEQAARLDAATEHAAEPSAFFRPQRDNQD